MSCACHRIFRAGCSRVIGLTIQRAGSGEVPSQNVIRGFHFAHGFDTMPGFVTGPIILFLSEKQSSTMSSQKDQYKEKFRPDTDSALERELSAALGEVPLEKLYGFDK